MLLLVIFGGCGGSDVQIERPRSNKAEVAIRKHLVDEFLYERWYSHVGEIEVVGHRALVETALGARGRSTAQRICAAVLSSEAASRALVEFGESRIQACP